MTTTPHLRHRQSSARLVRGDDYRPQSGAFHTVTDQPTVLCGVCLSELASPAAKAAHLRMVHGATVRVLPMADGAAPMYAWTLS